MFFANLSRWVEGETGGLARWKQGGTGNRRSRGQVETGGRSKERQQQPTVKCGLARHRLSCITIVVIIVSRRAKRLFLVSLIQRGPQELGGIKLTFNRNLLRENLEKRAEVLLRQWPGPRPRRKNFVLSSSFSFPGAFHSLL